MAKLRFRQSDLESAKSVIRKRAKNHRILFWFSLALNYFLLTYIYINK